MKVAGTVIGGATLLAWLALSGARAHDETREAFEHRRQSIERVALAQADPTATTLADDETRQVSLRFLDDATGEGLPALARVTNAEDGRAIRLPGEIHRAENWYSLAPESALRLPRRKLRFEALQGLETERAERIVDLSVGGADVIELRLRRFADRRAERLRSGNTHLHLRGMSIAEMDRYLRLVPQSDGLELVFVSYLSRVPDDRDYSSNTLTAADLARMSGAGVLLGNGEEHRHNFGRGGEGYGHVMFLNLQKLIEPVSIGSGIMQSGTDGPPLRDGIDAARADGATVIWCHNRFGLEDIPSWLAGALDAQNIHDGGVHGSYEDTFYRYLNLGLAVPFSTGTDWFIYDFARVYVPLAGELNARDWLRQLAAGRTSITNGPLLDLNVGDAAVGDILRIDRPATMRVRGRGVGRLDFRALELVHNGRVIQAEPTRTEGGHFVATLEHDVLLDDPGWLALRIPQVQQKNELGQSMFAHTSPVYVELSGRRIFQHEAAKALLAELRAAPESIDRQARFADDAERQRVLRIYADAIRALEARLDRS